MGSEINRGIYQNALQPLGLAGSFRIRVVGRVKDGEKLNFTLSTMAIYLRKT